MDDRPATIDTEAPTIDSEPQLRGLYQEPMELALLKQLDAEQGAEFRRIVEAEATERFGSSDGTLRIPNRVFVIGATSSA